MDIRLQATARQCLEASESGSLSFPEIVGRLGAAGFESYLVDFRSRSATYYLADGEALALPLQDGGAVAPRLDAEALSAAIREAQAKAPGYSYRGFCDKARRAGCAGYLVSFPGRRVLYFGRSADSHVEHFPPAP